jgi:hypothetical protein
MHLYVNIYIYMCLMLRIYLNECIETGAYIFRHGLLKIWEKSIDGAYDFFCVYLYMPSATYIHVTLGIDSFLCRPRIL